MKIDDSLKDDDDFGVLSNWELMIFLLSLSRIPTCIMLWEMGKEEDDEKMMTM